MRKTIRLSAQPPGWLGLFFYFPAAGGSASFGVTAGASCVWTGTPSQAWIHTSSTGSGNGTVNYTVDANPASTSRSATIGVQDQTFTVTQSGCSLSVDPGPITSTIPATGGTYCATITATSDNCTWIASNNGCSWFTLSCDNGCAGSAHVCIIVSTNESSQTLTCQVTIAGQIFTVTQAGGTCGYSIAPASASPGSGSGSGSFGVTAGNGCSWTASSDAPSWLHTSSSGSGSGTVNYTYDANSSTDPRIGHITVGGQAFTVNQASLSGGGGETNALTVAKLKAKLSFAKPHADSCSLKATFDPAPGFNPAGKTMTLDIGDAQVSFTLDSKGRGVAYQGTCRLTYNKRTSNWTLTANLRGGDWQTSWAAYGLVDADVSPLGVPVKFPVLAVVGDEAFAGEKSLVYKAKPGKSGSAR